MKSKASLALVLMLAITVGTVVGAALLISREISQTASIGVVGDMQVYWDVGCTEVATAHDWGPLVQDETIYKDLYVRSEGANVPLELTYSLLGFDGVYDNQLGYYGPSIDNAILIFKLELEGAVWRTTETKTLAVDQVVKVTMQIKLLDASTAMTFAFSTIFTAQE